MLGTGRYRHHIEKTMNMSQYRQQPRPQCMYSQKFDLEMSSGTGFPTQVWQRDELDKNIIEIKLIHNQYRKQ